MKITSQEEYGLRLLIRIAGCTDKAGMTIRELSEAEGLTSHYIAKLTRVLRMAGFINSTPGHKGGYVLAQPANEIILKPVLEALGGALYSKDFCVMHAGTLKLCTHSIDCSARSLWKMIQFTVDQLLSKVTLDDLVKDESRSTQFLKDILERAALPAEAEA